MWTAEHISAVANIVTAGATIAAVVVAAFGLKTWKRELKGRAEFEVARALARCVYALREALKGYRSPLYASHEFLAGDMESADSYAHLLRNRWQPVREALISFDSAVLEAESLWGPDAKTRTNRLEFCVRRVQVATDSFLADKRAGGRNFEADPDFGKKTRSDLAGTLANDTNELSREINAAVAEIEEMLKPHLTRQ